MQQIVTSLRCVQGIPPCDGGIAATLKLPDIANWIVQTCLIHGSSTSTAYKVAGEFIQGLEQTGYSDDSQTKTPSDD